MFPDRAALYVVAIEDRQYKDFKIHCKSPFDCWAFSVSLSLSLCVCVCVFAVGKTWGPGVGNGSCGHSCWTGPL